MTPCNLRYALPALLAAGMDLSCSRCQKRAIHCPRCMRRHQICCTGLAEGTKVCALPNPILLRSSVNVYMLHLHQCFVSRLKLFFIPPVVLISFPPSCRMPFASTLLFSSSMSLGNCRLLYRTCHIAIFRYQMKFRKR
jgi:hypothetical protein